jgi:predicted phosphodiesterase
MSVKLALIGGVYNNYLALDTAVKDATERGVDKIYCLGDLGAFGPHPDRVFPIIHENNIEVVQGNYDNSVGNNLSDCQCGYTDPRDNYYAKLSYDYTFINTSEENKKFMKHLPKEIRLNIYDKEILLCHGSPRKTNEFLWESTTPTHFLGKLFSDYNADVILGTHTGIHWKRFVDDKLFVNVGVIGRPENNGSTKVGYTILTIDNNYVDSEYIPFEYDHERLAKEMKEEKIAEPFIRTILTGWWTTCLEVLPAKERIRGKY